VFGVCGGSRFSQETDVFVIGEGGFVEHRFRLGTNGIFNRFKVYRF